MRGCWHVTCVLRCLAVFLKVVTKCSILLQGIGKRNMNTRSEIVHLCKRIYHYQLGCRKFVSGPLLKSHWQQYKSIRSDHSQRTIATKHTIDNCISPQLIFTKKDINCLGRKKKVNIATRSHFFPNWYNYSYTLYLEDNLFLIQPRIIASPGKAILLASALQVFQVEVQKNNSNKFPYTGGHIALKENQEDFVGKKVGMGWGREIDQLTVLIPPNALDTGKISFHSLFSFKGISALPFGLQDTPKLHYETQVSS